MTNHPIPFVHTLQQYLKRLKHQLSLASAGKTPSIVFFENRSLFVAEHGKIHLAWKAENAHHVTITQIGAVTGRTEIVAKMPPNTQKFILTAHGGFSKVRKELLVKVTPMHAEKIPKGQLTLPKPSVKSFAMQQKGGIFNQASKINKGGVVKRWPTPPDPADWKRLQNSLKGSLEVEKLEKLEAHLTMLKQQDLLEAASIFT